MIESIGIKNYKSIVDLQFDVGRVNVFIGENGSGKSNILEAIALAAAAEAGKLDNEFLTSRGIRLTSPFSMRSNFNSSLAGLIEISVKTDEKEKEYQLENDNNPYSKWTCKSNNLDMRKSKEIIELEKRFQELERQAKTIEKILNELPNGEDAEDLKSDFRKAKRNWEKIGEDSILYSQALHELKPDILYFSSHGYFSDYDKSAFQDMIIYSPEETALRNLYREGQIEPLGVNGEGLLKLVKVLLDDSSKTSLEILKESLMILDWVEDIDVSSPEEITAEAEHISVLDRFTQSWFDQRSANEGFLFVLFYAALMISKDTPSIFAVDNVDASLNPKLCTKIVSDVIKLAKQFDKQCFLTAHNPAILDGINLGDDEQRLFVVSRNRKGHTRVKRIGIESKPISSTGEELKLSEAFLRGYLGGLPKNF